LDLDIRSTVFQPANAEEPYYVQASAISSVGIAASRKGARKSAAAVTLEEAAAKCCELARALKHALEECGHEVRSFNCSHCPDPHAPACRQAAPRPPQSQPI
jgi:hypothetical protein